jgi:hypothetical protein
VDKFSVLPMSGVRRFLDSLSILLDYLYMQSPSLD